MHHIIINPISLPPKEIFAIYFYEFLQYYKLTAAGYARGMGYSARAGQYWAKGTNAPPLEVIADVLVFAVAHEVHLNMVPIGVMNPYTFEREDGHE